MSGSAVALGVDDPRLGWSAAGPDLPVAQISPADSRASAIFIHVAFLACIVLQRFGLMAGNSTLFLSTPVFAILIGWMLYTGRGRIRTELLLPFVIFLAAVALSTAAALTFRDPRVQISLTSPVALIMNYVVFLVGPTARFDKQRVLEIFVKYARFISISGIIQYLIQFAGIRIFSFMVSFPFLDPILVEAGFNNMPTTGFRSSTYRSNGFFMLEPSIFSQLIVLAVCVEFFVLKRWKYLPLYAIAYVVTYSGTGALCLALALPFYVLLFFRESKQVMGFMGAGLLLAGLSAVVLPDQFASLTNRSAEFQSSGSSGYKRYAGQFESLDVVIGEGRMFIGYGPGATDRATFFIEGSGGTIQKLMIDYGLFGCFAFFSFLLPGIWRRDLALVPILMIMLFLLGGGKLFAAYAITLMAMICVWGTNPRRPGPLHPLQDGSLALRSQ